MAVVIRGQLALPAQRRRAAQFAELLDGHRSDPDRELASLAALAATLRTAEPVPDLDFGVALRARLVGETAARATLPRVPAQRGTRSATDRPRRVRQAVATLTAVALVGGVGAAAASTRMLPGDALYGLKRGLESVQLSLAGSDLSRGRELLEQAGTRLEEAERMAGASGAVAPETQVRIGQALHDMDAALRDGALLLNDVYRDTGDSAALELLDRFVTEQQTRLALLLDRLALIDQGLRDAAGATADLLASLHADVTAVTRSSATAGAARDPAASDDGWAQARISADLVRPGQEATRVSADGAQAPSATGGSDPGVLGDLTGEGAQSSPAVPTAVVAPTPDVPDVGAKSTTLDLPCVPVAPLTTC